MVTRTGEGITSPESPVELSRRSEKDANQAERISITGAEQLATMIDPRSPFYFEIDNARDFVEIDREGWLAYQEIKEGHFSLENFSKIAVAWAAAESNFTRVDYSFSNKDHMPYAEDYQLFKGYWTNKLNTYSFVMERILEGRYLPDYYIKSLEKPYTLDVTYFGIPNFMEYISDPANEAREQVADFLFHKFSTVSLELKENRTYNRDYRELGFATMADYALEAGPGFFNQYTKWSYLREQLAAPLVDIGRIFADEKNKEALNNIMNRLLTADEKELADDILISPGLDVSSRLVVSVAEINSFGVIPVIETISRHTNEIPEMTEVYSQLQGEEVTKIMENLTEVYEVVDFKDYALNSKELTTFELGIVEESLTKVASKLSKSPKEIRILDVGAGTGRHAIPMYENGYHVTALEYESKHVAEMRKESVDIPIMRVDWHRLPFLDSAKNPDLCPEFAYCLGRTILHNNSPEKMFGFFDELHRVLDDEQGSILIDIPTIDTDVPSVSDEYKERIDAYAKHLEALGVYPTVVQHLFDGPDAKHKFNRMSMSEQQLRAYGRLTGYTVTNVGSTPIKGEKGSFTNSYYQLTKDPDFNIESMPPSEFNDCLRTVGLLDPGTDFNRLVTAWGVPLGVGIVFISGGQNEYMPVIRRKFARGLLGRVTVLKEGDTWNLGVVTTPYKKNSEV